MINNKQLGFVILVANILLSIGFFVPIPLSWIFIGIGAGIDIILFILVLVNIFWWLGAH